ncbi:MAG: lysophospholipid acyltransferase family protein [Phycisphaerales bacterium]
MQDFDLKPANDLGLTHRERTLSLARESGLIETATHFTYWSMMRAYLTLYHRMKVTGRENIPVKPPYVMVANHCSHLDSLMMVSVQRWRLRDKVFPLAAGDYFFETPTMATFAMFCINALPLWRRNCGRHVLGELRKRLISEPCAFVLFPEGTRSPDGKLGPFKAGLGMIVAGAEVPVVPCRIFGAMEAFPRNKRLPRPRQVRLAIGKPLDFRDTPNNRTGWDHIAEHTHAAVESLAGDAIDK